MAREGREASIALELKVGICNLRGGHSRPILSMFCLSLDLLKSQEAWQSKEWASNFGATLFTVATDVEVDI
ncbi:hypothetical protein COLO4_30701 [Corchorus olitorius]|uniref:Uncharacterized protein n=1 Tax=Corchorus olitorius TaxID=93759 RepID=A0A1R3H749_9ROSI|nr:hypothetical protein COLO4_30701 [Corchorus olitorius]